MYIYMQKSIPSCIRAFDLWCSVEGTESERQKSVLHLSILSRLIFSCFTLCPVLKVGELVGGLNWRSFETCKLVYMMQQYVQN